MIEGPTIKHGPWYLRLLVLLSCLGTTKSLVGPDLSCNVSVKHRRTAGKCSVNGYTLFQLDNESQDTLLHQLMKEENAAKACRDLPPRMKSILEESSKITGDHTINVTMHSRYHKRELIDPCWAIAIDGRPPIYFYPSNKTWRPSHPDARSTMKQWEANSDLTQGLSTLSNGDFRKCLRILPTHLKEKPRSTTIKIADTTQLTSAIQSPPTVNSTQRPWSTWKIGLPIGVATVLGVAIAAVYCVSRCRRNMLASHSWCWDALSGKDIGEGALWSHPIHCPSQRLSVP
ncbi:histocompatibility antigen 60b-like [Acomys russatus]|uniref:histocompatibility antigen 60b-like n=1 Tax=Acomys russatus TaxID=60746 RepID=UPI0021E2DA82|nr:histocompatibility antigen 60b-like [Acomys russatus]